MDCYSLAIAMRDVDEAESGRSSIMATISGLCEFGPSDSSGSGFCHIITLACRTIHLPFSFQKYITDESRDLSVYHG
jgi:hypothetical protein